MQALLIHLGALRDDAVARFLLSVESLCCSMADVSLQSWPRLCLEWCLFSGDESVLLPLCSRKPARALGGLRDVFCGFAPSRLPPRFASVKRGSTTAVAANTSVHLRWSLVF